MDFFSGVGSQEILVILLVAVIFIGPAKIVEFSKNVGKITHRIKQATNELTTNITAELEEEQKKQTAIPKQVSKK